MIRRTTRSRLFEFFRLGALDMKLGVFFFRKKNLKLLYFYPKRTVWFARKMIDTFNFHFN